MYIFWSDKLPAKINDFIDNNISPIYTIFLPIIFFFMVLRVLFFGEPSFDLETEKKFEQIKKGWDEDPWYRNNNHENLVNENKTNLIDVLKALGFTETAAEKRAQAVCEQYPRANLEQLIKLSINTDKNSPQSH